jgi:hypothetical protein
VPKELLGILQASVKRHAHQASNIALQLDNANLKYQETVQVCAVLLNQYGIQKLYRVNYALKLNQIGIN